MMKKKIKDDSVNHLKLLYEFLRKDWRTLVIDVLCILSFFLIPLGINIMLPKIKGTGSNEAWIGFWGSYLGSGASILFAYVNTKRQIKINQKNEVKVRNMKRINGLLSNSMKAISKIYPVYQEIHENLQIKSGKDLKFRKINEFQDIVHDFMMEWNSIAVTLQLDDITKLYEKMDEVRISFGTFEIFCASLMNGLVAKNSLSSKDYKHLKDIEDGMQNFIEKFSGLINFLSNLYDTESRK